MSYSEHVGKVVTELSRTLGAVDDDAVEALVTEIEQAQAIFVAGAGRSGLAVRAFAMRLMHMGRHVYVVSETTTPNITEADLLLVGSGSGATESLVAIATRARQRFNARVALVTIFPESPIGQLAHVVVTIAAPTSKGPAGAQTPTSIQPMGSLFEQSLLLLLDIVILRLMDRAGQDSATMFTRHANLE